ncbi:MAG: hypothetical protein JWR16_765 [Nevskia sp.]|nr:hypothetical protein [Nevskia sp.]
MARDYARPPNRPNNNRPANRTPTRKPAPGKRGGGLPGWAGIVVGLAIGLVVAAIVWIERPAPATQLGKGAAATTTSTGSATAGKDDSKKPIALPPKQPSRFAFYEMLPSYEVVIPREDAAAAAKTGKPANPALAATIAAPGQYLIQVGAYKTRDEAEKGRANLALLGVESKIEQVTIDQSATWYRVRIGPENDLAKAQEILQRLESNDIKGMLIKVKAG